MNKYIVKLWYSDRLLMHCTLHVVCMFRHKCWWGNTEENWELHRQIKTTNFKHGWASRAERICNLPNQSERCFSVLKALERPTDACTIRFMHLQTTGSEDVSVVQRFKDVTQHQYDSNSKHWSVFFPFPLPLSRNSIEKYFSCQIVSNFH